MKNTLFDAIETIAVARWFKSSKMPLNLVSTVLVGIFKFHKIGVGLSIQELQTFSKDLWFDEINEFYKLEMVQWDLVKEELDKQEIWL